MTFSEKLYRYGPGLLVAMLAGLGVFNSVMNNAYEYGATFFDSAEFATVIWRSGLTLHMGPAFNGTIYPTHASTINYIPALFSYLWTGDRMNFYGLVYSLLYFAIVYTVYILILPMLPKRYGPVLAALGAALFFCGQITFDGAWEMRSDFASALFLLLGFRAWQLRHYRMAVVWMILNAMVREDMGIMTIVPIVLLAGLQCWSLRLSDPALAKEKLLWGIRLSAINFAWAVGTIYIQKNYFPVYDLFQDQYYDRANPLGHLTQQLMDQRLSYLWHNAKGIWLPLVVVALAGVFTLDLQMIVGAVAFMPYILGMFFSKSDMSAEFMSYKPFMFPLSVMWPALMAYGKPQSLQRRYAIIQALVLISGMFYLRPGFTDNFKHRWVLQPLTANAQIYRDFGEKRLEKEFDPSKLGTRVSHSILALYPYQFDAYWFTWVVSMKKEDTDKVNTLIWFENDRDQALIDAVLKSAPFDMEKVEGTKIWVAHRHVNKK